MAGFGKALVRGLLGAAQGYGNYLIMEGQQQLQEKRDQVTMMREQALARFRQQLQDESADKAVPRQKEIISYTAEEGRVSNALELKQRSAIDAQRDAREEKQRLSQEQRAEARDIRAEQRAEERRIREEQRAEARALESDASDPIVEWDRDDETGTKIGITKRGRLFDTGVKVTERSADGFSLAGEGTATKPAQRGWRGEAPSASDTPGFNTSALRRGGAQGGMSQRDRALSELSTIYGSATPERYPRLFRNGKKIPYEEAKRLVLSQLPN